MPGEVYVCQAGTCRARGSEAVLLEIEELAAAVGGCSVRPAGCLGYCNQAPNAIVLEADGGQKMHTQIDTLAQSAAVVTRATGKTPPLDDPGVQSRLEGVRMMRVREHAISVHKWNTALRAVTDELAQRESPPPQLRQVEQELLASAGFGEGLSTDLPTEIQMYTKWSLENVTLVSGHSAVLQFRSKDRKRYTPNPRGGGRRLPIGKTWHTTLLATVGPNSEGPLPYIERDYTPISTALDWERGHVHILIKIYPDGAATSWLHRTLKQAEASGQPAQVWLSRPVQTLSVPTLVAGTAAFRPASVLLLLAGTGVVALPQILQHREPREKLGFCTKKLDQLRVPVDLVLSCRSDDVLMLPEISQLCREASDFAAANPDSEVIKGLRWCTLLLTAKAPGDPPFADVEGCEAGLEDLQSQPNAQVLRSRLEPQLVAQAISRMPAPCRFVVSGPSGFNAAVREMLLEANVDDEAVTVLEA